MDKQYFQAESWWMLDRAEQYAKSMGYDTKWEDGNLFIELLYERGVYYIDDSTPGYPGFNRIMHTWNGWQCPLFTKREANKVIAHFNKNRADDDPEFKWVGREIHYIDDGEPQVIEAFTITCEGKQYSVWDLSLGWIWDKK